MSKVVLATGLLVAYVPVALSLNHECQSPCIPSKVHYEEIETAATAGGVDTVLRNINVLQYGPQLIGTIGHVQFGFDEQPYRPAKEIWEMAGKQWIQYVKV